MFIFSLHKHFFICKEIFSSYDRIMLENLYKALSWAYFKADLIQYRDV